MDNTYKSVVSHKNFYFSIDENKKRDNKKLWSTKSPGNDFHKP